MIKHCCEDMDCFLEDYGKRIYRLRRFNKAFRIYYVDDWGYLSDMHFKVYRCSYCGKEVNIKWFNVR